MFASRSVVEHLARGAVGLSALVGAVLLAPRAPWLSIGLIPLGLWALRGCPLCWTMGLVETVWARVNGRAADGECVDGRCVLSAKRTPAANSSMSSEL